MRWPPKLPLGMCTACLLGSIEFGRENRWMSVYEDAAAVGFYREA